MNLRSVKDLLTGRRCIGCGHTEADPECTCPDGRCWCRNCDQRPPCTC